MNVATSKHAHDIGSLLQKDREQAAQPEGVMLILPIDMSGGLLQN